MNILWFLDKEFDIALDVSARLATIKFFEEKHRVTIVTSFKYKRKLFNDIKADFIYIKKPKTPLIKTFFLYYKQVRLMKERPDLTKHDIIFVNSNNFLLLKKLIGLRKQNKFKLVLDIRTLPAEFGSLKKIIGNSIFKKSLRIAASNFDGISYITEEMKHYCEIKFRLPPHKFTVWNSGVDIEIFKPEDSIREDKKFRIIYHGKITKNRCVENVVKALYIIKNSNIEFILLGHPREINEIRKISKKLRISDNILFFDSVPHKEVPKYINYSDAGILPFPRWSVWNVSSPIKLFEYLACAKPVIVTRIPAHASVLDGKEFAFWAESSSPDSLAEAILEAYNHKKYFKKIGGRARQFVIANYGWKKQLIKLEKFFDSV